MKRAHFPLGLILIALFSCLSHAGDMIPFTLPWDDNASGITDFSTLNHKPAGKFGFVGKNDEGHFVIGEERIRFLGVNTTGPSNFPTHEESEKIAARLAKFGFNVVRFHHMDNNWGQASIIDYSQGNSRNLNTTNLELLDYFAAQLKANGIYLNINLINSREFQVADGLDADIGVLDWKGRHMLGLVDETFRNLEKEYATKLITHVNPYTGLSYANDPAVAVIEINNENGVFQTFFDGNLDIWPTVYKDQLQAGWNTWLQAKYTSTSNLLEGWSGKSVPLGGQIIDNPNFNTTISPWNFEQNQSAAANATVGTFDSRQGVRIEVITPGSAGWHIQLNQGGKNLVEGQLYTISFWVKADSASTVSAAIGLAYDPWSVVHSFSGIEATTEWVEKTFLFRSAVSDNNLRLNFNGFAEQTGVIYLSDVTLHEGGSLEATLPAGETLEAGNISNNLRSESYIEKRALDWTRYLSYIATDYWTDMRNYIRDTLEYAGLINGSTIMNSPPNIQGQLDFADTHAYWQHPVFPGDAWDANNWYVNQESMVNTLNNNIPNLASQHIEGLPHTISEYRHSYPTKYSSEGPLIISAYSAMHDWDGIYFFDYAKGGDNWDQGYFDNYFNMNAHPTSMANAAIAANLFRRGHVSRSEDELLMNFSPEQEIEAITSRGRPWNVGDGRQLDIQPAHALTGRVSLSIGEDATGLETDPPSPSTGPIYTASESQLTWDMSTTDKGVVTINTQQTKAMVGFIDGRSFTLDNVSIGYGTTINDWATVALTLREGYFGFPEGGGQLLIVATGNTENTNMIWTNDDHNSVGPNWGEAPSLVEAIPATITLPYPTNRIQAWALDQTGQRTDMLTPTVNGGHSTLEIGGSIQSLWYEVQIAAEPNVTEYDFWKFQNFTTSQLADNNISGSNADPDGDGIPNFFEFAFLNDPHSSNSNNESQVKVEWRENKPIFVYKFHISNTFSPDNLLLGTSQDLSKWTQLALSTSELEVTITPLSPNFDQVCIEYIPKVYPSYIRLEENE